MRRLPHAIAVLLCLACSGCFQNYWQNRQRDLHDAFLYDAQVGIGLNADVRIGPLAWGLGLGSRSFAAWGKVDWWSDPTTFTETNLSFLTGAMLRPPSTALLALATRSIHKTPVSADLSSYRDIALLGLDLTEDLVRVGKNARGETSPRARPQRRWLDHFGIEFGTFAGVAGTRVGFHPLEFADFLLGWVGLDLLLDDR